MTSDGVPDLAALTTAVLATLGGVPGQAALGVLISAMVTVIIQCCPKDGQQVAEAVGQQIGHNYAIAQAMFGMPPGTPVN